MVLGATRMFDDEFYESEKNGRLADVFFKWLVNQGDCQMG